MSHRIKTLDEILAEMNTTASISHAKKPAQSATTDSDAVLTPTQAPPQTTNPKSARTQKQPPACVRSHSDGSTNTPPTPQSKRPKNTRNHPKTTPIKDIKGNDALHQVLSEVSCEPIYQNDKTINRLRWLAFYYLSNKELSQHQLRQKLLNKVQDVDLIDDLLDEFAQKGYQSDERFVHMVIRESIRKGRGVRHIQQTLRQAGIHSDDDLQTMVQKAGIDNLTDGTDIHSQTSSEQVDWLLLAVQARCKKYGNHLPKTPKEQARQFRFLQYRGFSTDVCFDALKHTPDDFE